MEKNKFIADKIQKLIRGGEERNRAIAIAYAEYNGMEKMQQGGDLAYNEPSMNKINSKLKNIDYIQSGVNNAKLGNGMYVYTSDGIREFVTNDAYKTTMQDTNELKNYLNTTGGIDRSLPNTENKSYRPIKVTDKDTINSNLMPIDYIQSGVNNTKLGNGYYLNYKNGLRDFVTEEAFNNNKNNSSIKNYLNATGGINRHIQGTENKIYRPNQTSSKMKQGGYYESNNPYFLENPGQIQPQNEEKNDYGADYMSMSTEEENLSPLLTEDKKIMSKEEYDGIRLANLYGNVSPQMYGYGLGKAIEKGDGFGATVNGLGLGLGTAKNILSGLGDTRMNEYAYNQYKQKQQADNSEYKPLQQGGYIPQLKKKENTEVINPNIDKTNAELLTGEYLTEDNTNPNVELEVNEKVLHSDTGQIQTAEGNKHSQGGIKTELSEGSQVLSDYTKINAKNSKYFSDIFNIKAEVGDTFAKTLDKIESKIGLKKLLKEEKELNLKIEKELQKQNPDKQTQDLNMQLLSEHSDEINKKKDELNGVRKIAFQELFEKQEMIPKRGKNNEILKQEGGQINNSPQQIIEVFAQTIQKDPREIIQMMQQMSSEKQQEALSQMYQALQSGQQSPQEEQAEGEMSNLQEEQQEMQYAQEGIRIGSKFENADLYKKQTPTTKDWKTFGQLLKEKPTEALSEIKRLHPELYNRYFKDDKIPTYDKIRSFQEGLNSKYESIKQDYIKTYGADSPQVKSVDEAINKDKFLPMRNEYDEKQDRIVNKEIRGTDSFLGDWTATRPNFAIDILPQKDLEDVNKVGVNTASQLKDKFPDLYKKYVESKGLTSDFWLGKVADSPVVETSVEKETDIPILQEVRRTKGERVVVPNIPTYYGQAPTPLEPVYKGDISLGRLNPNKISIEPNLVEASRQILGVQGSLEGLSPTQRAVALQNIYTQNQNATNQAISQAQLANANSQLQVDQFNIGQAGKEDLTNLQNVLSYEQRNLGGKAKYEANLQRYFNNIAEVDKQNWRDVNNLNLLNARSDNFQTDGSNFYRTADDPTFNNTYGGAGFNRLSENDKLAQLKKQVSDTEKAIKKSQKTSK